MLRKERSNTHQGCVFWLGIKSKRDVSKEMVMVMVRERRMVGETKSLEWPLRDEITSAAGNGED